METVATTNSDSLFDSTFLAAAITALIGVIVYFFGVRQGMLERKRKACSEALADALAWLEVPYRIRRRTNDDAETVQAIVNHVHQLQERLLFHASWLRVELPTVHVRYEELVAAVKRAALDASRTAWESPPVTGAAGMNVGSLGIPSTENEVRVFATEVSKRLVLWKIWE